MVAGEREIDAGGAHGASHGHNLAVELKGDAGGKVEAAEVGRLRAAAGEGRIERAIRIIAGHREVAAAVPHNHDLAVRLERDAGGPVGTSELGRHPATPPEWGEPPKA